MESTTLTGPERMVRRFLTTDVGIWFGRYVLPYLDGPILRLNCGKYSMSPGQPILLMIATGAKTGKRRATPLLYQRDGQRVIIIASNGGRDKHPSWYYNLRKNPRVTLYIEGRVHDYQAREVQGEERATCWQRAREYFVGFDLYEQRTSRAIPVMVLDSIPSTRM